jgi:hypothetical protein
VNLPEPRSAAQRKADTLAKLSAPAADIWVASAALSPDGVAQPYLVPLSLAWVDGRIVLALEADSRTARSLPLGTRTRLALGPTRDVVMIDATVEQVASTTDTATAVADAYAAQSDWDPRTAGPGFVYLMLAPTRIQAWREVNELADRTLMRNGEWLV